MIKPRTLKGFRDFLPQDARKRQYVIETLRKVFESYGFEPLETPALEYEEILGGKYGYEGEKLMYRFTDQGGRNVAMRYDQTVPLSRVVAQYRNELPNPFKRYQIQNVWRAENTQKGRYREFYQADIDVTGSTSTLSDAEMIAVIYNTYVALGFQDIKLLLNDRSIFGDLPSKAIMIIDKIEKIGESEVIKQLEEIGVANDSYGAVKNANPTNQLQTIIDHAVSMGVPATSLQFSPTLARGLDYYTGIIIEAQVPGIESGSLGGGGRYDKLIGIFNREDIPAVGFAFGFDRTIEAMERLDLFPNNLTTTQVLVTVFDTELLNYSLEITTRLRKNGINTEIYLDQSSKIEKQLKYADKKNIPFAIILGSQERDNNTVTIKDLDAGQQQTMPLDEIIAYIKK